MSVEAFFDDTCGFSNRARHRRDPLESDGGQQFIWRPFSLLQQNRGGGGGPVFGLARRFGGLPRLIGPSAVESTPLTGVSQ